MNSLLAYYLILGGGIVATLILAPIIAAKVEPWFSKRVLRIDD